MNSPKQTEEKSVMDFKEMLRQLVSWMNMGRFNPHAEVGENDPPFCDSVMRKSFYLNENKDWIRIMIFTQTNEYVIDARLRHDGTAYLGCVASCRKPRAGEDWTRGRDLADGDFCRETWFKILADIVSAESVAIQRPVELLVRKVRNLVADGPVPIIHGELGLKLDHGSLGTEKDEAE